MSAKDIFHNAVRSALGLSWVYGGYGIRHNCSRFCDALEVRICGLFITTNSGEPALEKEGWIITHDPLFIKVEELDFFIDLAGEKILAAEKDGFKIAVEIKSFIGASDLASFYIALGQFLSYRSALRKKLPNRILYLAINQDVYNDFFSNRFIQELIAEHQLKLLIFDAIQEGILLWKE